MYSPPTVLVRVTPALFGGARGPPGTVGGAPRTTGRGCGAGACGTRYVPYLLAPPMLPAVPLAVAAARLLPRLARREIVAKKPPPLLLELRLPMDRKLPGGVPLAAIPIDLSVEPRRGRPCATPGYGSVGGSPVGGDMSESERGDKF